MASRKLVKHHTPGMGRFGPHTFPQIEGLLALGRIADRDMLESGMHRLISEDFSETKRVDSCVIVNPFEPVAK
jgi:hypothetical protein